MHTCSSIQSCGAAYLLTAFYGVQLWQFYVFPGWTVAYVVKWLLILGFFGSVPVSLWNIYDHYHKNASRFAPVRTVKQLVSDML